MKKENYFFYLFLVCWTVLNILQSVFLDINTDEAYYHFYSQHLQWGYFDHPPVVATLIKAGYWLIPGQLGVRFPFILMSTASIYLLWRITGMNEIKLFVRIILSIAAVHVMGFHALPEIPLIFFCLLYFYLLKKYLDKDNAYLVIPLSLVIVLMLLSKYYGLFILLATLFGAPHIIKRKSFWFTVALSGIMLIPHLLWQIENDFISIKFHLLERNFGWHYTAGETLSFIIKQPLMSGPFIGFILFYLSFKYRVANNYDRVLKWILYIFYGFFLISTFRGKVLNLWTSTAIAPLIILACYEIRKNPAYLKRHETLLKVIFISSISFLLIGRIMLMYDFIPHSSMKYDYLHCFKDWTRKIKNTARDHPVVFVNTLEETSRYMFYSKEYAHALGTLEYKRTHFDFSDQHRKLLGKTVLLLSGGDSVLDAGNNKKYHFQFYEHFATYPGIQIESMKKKYLVVKENPGLSITIGIIQNPYTKDELAISKAFLIYGIFNARGEMLLQQETGIELQSLIAAKDGYPIEIKMPTSEKKYFLRWGIRCGTLPPTLNSGTILI